MRTTSAAPAGSRRSSTWGDYAAWLGPTSKDAQAIIDRARGHAFVTAPVNPAMRNARNKGPAAAAVLEP
jgi:hypothetical protein